MPTPVEAMLHAILLRKCLGVVAPQFTKNTYRQGVFALAEPWRKGRRMGHIPAEVSGIRVGRQFHRHLARAIGPIADLPLPG
jgi:hypothetical protein